MAYFFETGEEGKQLTYITHYFKTNPKAMKNSLIEFCKENKLSVIDFNDEYNEGCIATDKIILNISFNQISPIKTGIDFNIEADYFLFGRKNVTILLEKIYEYLDKKHQLLGIGLENVK